jgi:glycosyltransferase involved in cell wall biosynthesis
MMENIMENDKKTKIRILEVTGGMNAGGAETLLMNIVRTKDSDVQIDFLENFSGACLYDQELKKCGCRIFKIRKYRVYNFFSYRRELKNFFRKHPNEWDVVHGHIPSSSGIYLKMAKRFHFITVMHCHTSVSGSGLKGLYMKHVVRVAVKNSDYFMTCGREAGVAFFGPKAGEEAFVLPGGVVYSNFVFSENDRQRIRSQLSIPKTAIVIGEVARLVKCKNQKFLLRLCSLMNSEQKDREVHVILIGDGEEMGPLEELCHKLKLEKFVHFEGAKANGDLYPFYSAFDVFAMPSFYEGVPVVVSEALINGLKVLLSANISKDARLNQNVSFLPIKLESDLKLWSEKIFQSDLTRVVDPNMEKYDSKNTGSLYKKFMCEAIEGKRK